MSISTAKNHFVFARSQTQDQAMAAIADGLHELAKEIEDMELHIKRIERSIKAQ